MRFRKVLAAVAIGAGMMLAGVTTAHAVTVSQFTGSHSTRWWDAATCRAFAAGDVHSMVLDSRHAGGWLRADVAHLAHDARSHAAPDVMVNDQLNILMDCHEQG